MVWESYEASESLLYIGINSMNHICLGRMMT